MTSQTSPAAQVTDRIGAVAQVRELFGPNHNADEVMRMAEWILTGAVSVDPARLEHAARALAVTQGVDWSTCTAGVENELRGQALQTITAYLAGQPGRLSY